MVHANRVFFRCHGAILGCRPDQYHAHTLTRGHNRVEQVPGRSDVDRVGLIEIIREGRGKVQDQVRTCALDGVLDYSSETVVTLPASSVTSRLDPLSSALAIEPEPPTGLPSSSTTGDDPLPTV